MSATVKETNKRLWPIIRQDNKQAESSFRNARLTFVHIPHCIFVAAVRVLSENFSATGPECGAEPLRVVPISRRCQAGSIVPDWTASGAGRSIALLSGSAANTHGSAQFRTPLSVDCSISSSSSSSSSINNLCRTYQRRRSFINTMTMWKTVGLVLSVLVSVGLVASRNDDRFNYRSTVGRDFGPTDWNRVTCDDVQRCVSTSWFALYGSYWWCGWGRFSC